MNNQEQIDAAAGVLCTHSDYADDPETAVADLLANLMHFCGAKKVSFVQALQRAQCFYATEFNTMGE